MFYTPFFGLFFSPRFHCLKEAVFGSVTGAHLEQLCLTASLLEKSEGSFQLSELPEDQAGVCVCVCDYFSEPSSALFVCVIIVYILHCLCARFRASH